MTKIQKGIWSIFKNGTLCVAVVFVLTLLLPPWRFLLLAVGCMMWYLSQKVCGDGFNSRCLNFLREHSLGIALAVLLLGVVLRLVLLFAFRIDRLAEPYVGDPGAYLYKVRSFVSGVWIQNKSWTTVLAYGIWAKVFSSNFLSLALCGNTLQIVTVITAYFVGKRVFGVLGALALEIFVATDFMYITFSNAIYLENVYFLAVILAFCASLFMFQSSSMRMAVVSSAIAGALSWLVVWTRSDGIVVPLALCVVLCVSVLCGKMTCGKAKLIVFLGTALSFAVLSIATNYTVDGSKTIFCSNDNYIPRVVGLDYSTMGTWHDGEVVKEIKEAYVHDHPEKREMVEKCKDRQPYPYMNELIPYCKAAMQRRLDMLSPMKIVRLIAAKESRIFCQSGSVNSVHWLASAIITGYRNAVIVVCVCILAIGIMRRKRERFSLIEYFFLVATTGIAMIYAMGESDVRYSALFYLLIVMTAADRLNFDRDS